MLTNGPAHADTTATRDANFVLGNFSGAVTDAIILVAK